MKTIYLALVGVAILAPACVQEADEPELDLSCRDSCFEIQGRFTTEDGTVGVSHLPLKLLWYPNSGQEPQVRTIVTETTDEDGYYQLKFFMEQELKYGSNFAIDYSPDSTYSSLDNIISLDHFGYVDTTVVRNYHLPKTSRIRLVVDNPSDIGASERLTCYVTYRVDKINGNTYYTSGIINTQETSVRDTVVEAAGNQYSYIYITKTKGDITENISDSVNVPVDGELTYQITF